MENAWYVFIFVMILIIIYKIISAKPRAVALTIAQRINIKPHFVEEMITAMGSERGKFFVDHISTKEDGQIQNGVYTFIVYQIMKNDHEENIKWWKSKLNEHGINPRIESGSANLAFMYLRDAGADIAQVSNFMRVYNSID